MVFSSVPLYLDPPSWTNHHHQQQQGEVVDGTTSGCSSLLPPPPPLLGGGGGGGSARPPGSMTERARLAKVAPPEAALKCPRCDSTNTKFCYFNNYSLSQPRHFCKTCRRYWTRGGALRNVPVGGGCRRNKRSSKGSRSKSPAATRADHPNGAPPGATRSSADIILSAANHFQPPPIPFLPPLQSFGGFGASSELGLNFGENEMGFHQIGTSSGAATMNLSARFADLFRLQQGMTPLPFLSGLDQAGSGGLYQFEEAEQYGGGHHYHDHHHQLGGKGFESGGGGGGGATFHQVKMEGNNEGMNSNISRNFLGVTGSTGDEHFWTGNNNVNGYTTTSDLPIAGYSSSSTTIASRLL